MKTDVSNPNGYAVRWNEFKGDRLVTREQAFTTDKARGVFCAKLEAKPTFNVFLAWAGPENGKVA